MSEHDGFPVIKFENGIITNLEEILADKEWYKLNWADIGGFCTETRVMTAWLNEEDAVTHAKCLDKNIKKFYGYVHLHDHHMCGCYFRKVSIHESKTPEPSIIIKEWAEDNYEAMKDYFELYQLPLLPGQPAKVCKNEEVTIYDPKDVDKYARSQDEEEERWRKSMRETHD